MWHPHHSAHGSSPLARGTGCHPCAPGCRQRFIPAGAGNRAAGSKYNCLPAVHPRWRGEQWRTAASFSASAGSSPLARGTAIQDIKTQHCARFIPAGAGNSLSLTGMWTGTTVHPRWRGEQGRARQYSRGQPRFIPAGAGNRTQHRDISMRLTVHPRWRGEQTSSRHTKVPWAGSSPLARGTVARMF